MGVMIGSKKLKGCRVGSKKVKKIMRGSQKIWSAGNTVTYVVDAGVSYMEEVDEGVSCLSPKTFTSAKSGWEFVGWREDAAANGTVLSGKVMTDSPIVLYAVFRQIITLSYNGNGATSGSTAAQTGTRYYNNGNSANPAFTLRASGYGRTYYSFARWALNSAGGTQYAAGASVTLAANTTMYAMWTYIGVSVSKSLSFTFGVDTAKVVSFIANCIMNTGSGSGYYKDRTVLFTAPQKCTLSGTLTLSASGSTKIVNIVVVAHKDKPLGHQNGQIWQDVVTAEVWNESGLSIQNGSKSKTFAVGMEANQMILIWAIDQQDHNATGTVMLSFSGVYKEVV